MVFFWRTSKPGVSYRIPTQQYPSFSLEGASAVPSQGTTSQHGQFYGPQPSRDIGPQTVGPGAYQGYIDDLSGLTQYPVDASTYRRPERLRDEASYGYFEEVAHPTQHPVDASTHRLPDPQVTSYGRIEEASRPPQRPADAFLNQNQGIRFPRLFPRPRPPHLHPRPHEQGYDHPAEVPPQQHPDTLYSNMQTTYDRQEPTVPPFTLSQFHRYTEPDLSLQRFTGGAEIPLSRTTHSMHSEPPPRLRPPIFQTDFQPPSRLDQWEQPEQVSSIPPSGSHYLFRGQMPAPDNIEAPPQHRGNAITQRHPFEAERRAGPSTQPTALTQGHHFEAERRAGPSTQPTFTGPVRTTRRQHQAMMGQGSPNIPRHHPRHINRSRPASMIYQWADTEIPLRRSSSLRSWRPSDEIGTAVVPTPAQQELGRPADIDGAIGSSQPASQPVNNDFSIIPIWRQNRPAASAEEQMDEEEEEAEH
ncbi:hypothetical protein GALMADRAFT_141037 [Galerina marginata CBS 339.88]|uniref:Uncharacterized protein n=1 Tax=Galerina marginata (strain CBS 339.88) TaxID=685588 RepID=A0A067SX89_GALM3|nr:hypothetical protein GALMADRAFT_141037 [Galerina marginata CBS 339.88]